MGALSALIRKGFWRLWLSQGSPRGEYMVGAAGFEPTTCSTQNCRATRLRYTPNSVVRRPTRSPPRQQGGWGAPVRQMRAGLHN